MWVVPEHPETLESSGNAKNGHIGSGVTASELVGREGGKMASDTQVYREEFDTEAEAIAFTEGIDFIDSEHVSYEAPFEENDKWVIEVKKFC
jgi:hypothetical protein